VANRTYPATIFARFQATVAFVSASSRNSQAEPQHELALRDDRRRTRAFVDQGDVAEGRSGAERGDLEVAVRGSRRAGLDDEEADAALAFLCDDVTSLERALLEGAGDRLQVFSLDVLEQLTWLRRLTSVVRAASLQPDCVSAETHVGILRRRLDRMLREFLHLPLGGIQAPQADGVELLAALPE
jgi:hypothetical protein